MEILERERERVVKTNLRYRASKPLISCDSKQEILLVGIDFQILKKLIFDHYNGNDRA